MPRKKDPHYAPPYKRYVVTVRLRGKTVPFPEPKTKLQARRMADSLKKEGYSPKIKKMTVPRWNNALQPLTRKDKHGIWRRK